MVMPTLDKRETRLDQITHAEGQEQQTILCRGQRRPSVLARELFRGKDIFQLLRGLCVGQQREEDVDAFEKSLDRLAVFVEQFGCAGEILPLEETPVQGVRGKIFLVVELAREEDVCAFVGMESAWWRDRICAYACQELADMGPVEDVVGVGGVT